MQLFMPLILLAKLVLVATTANAEPMPDLSCPVQVQAPELLTESPLFYRDKEDSHLYHVLPKAFRIIQENGKLLKSIVRLPNGRTIISARIAAWPKDIERDESFTRIVSKIKSLDPEAKFLVPQFKDVSLKILGGSADDFESVTVTGSTNGSSDSYVILKATAEKSPKVQEDLKRALGVLGVISFKVKAFNGLQIIDWPVAFSWHLGDMRAQ